MNASTPTVRFAASWQTQFRFVQTLGRGLAEDIGAKVIVLAGGAAFDSGDVDLVFTKSVINEHRFNGKGIYAASEPVGWLRTIAWLPQEDRFLFAVAPQFGISTFEEIAERKPVLNMVAQRSVAPVLKQYGFSFEAIESWGGTVGSMHHNAQAAKERFDEGRLDACFGDGSEFDGSAWQWMAEHGYVFLGIRPDVMQELETSCGLRRNYTPAGFLPGISHNLLALDDSHVVLTCSEQLDAAVAYALAKIINERKREIERNSIQITVNESSKLPLSQVGSWSSMTTHIERQWDRQILGAPLHEGAARYYQEQGVL